MLLLRRDYEEEERNVFKPAEWRWTIPQVAMMMAKKVGDGWEKEVVSEDAGDGQESKWVNEGVLLVMTTIMIIPANCSYNVKAYA